MFFEGDRITAMREMIVARDEAGRRRALAKLLPMQRADFEGIFEAMDGLPVTIRLLDPPLHEFLPHGGEESKLLARTLGIAARRAGAHRGVAARDESDARPSRLPARHHVSRDHRDAGPRDLRGGRAREAPRDRRAPGDHGAARGDRAASSTTSARSSRTSREQVLGAMGEEVDYLIGTMIELPRAALTADEIAATAEFFSFGTNDLTQTTFGLSRDDAGRFLPSYVEHGIFPDDPFPGARRAGVGKLVRMAVEDGRRVRPELKVGICGEHGGEPRSVKLCHEIGLDYVSCSPFRVPIARLAAAQAALPSHPVDLKQPLASSQ